jgi:hypothetical protein
MYCILLNSTRPYYIPFLRFLLENKPNNFEIVEYSDITNINWENLKKYDYVVLLHRFCYVNFKKIIDYCSIKKPVFAGLTTYWGVGFPYLAVLSKNTIESIEKYHNSYNQYFDDAIENLLVNVLIRILKLSDIKELLSLTDDKLKEILSFNNVESLDDQCYLNNIEYTLGHFHNSTFVSFNDNEDGFVDFLIEYNSGKKFVKYKQKPYRLEIGKQFFVVKNYHVAILDSNILVFWHRESSSWKKAGVKFSKKIISYINKNFDIALDLNTNEQ